MLLIPRIRITSAKQEIATNCKRWAGSNGNIQMSLYTALFIIFAFLNLYTGSADTSGAVNNVHIKLMKVKNGHRNQVRNIVTIVRILFIILNQTSLK